MKELGFWEVNATTLQDVHEVAPSQEELQAAAEGTAPPEADRPAQVSLAPSVHGRTLEPLAEGSANWQNSWQNAFRFVS